MFHSSQKCLKKFVKCGLHENFRLTMFNLNIHFLSKLITLITIDL